jgi:hypothetical protein
MCKLYTYTTPSSCWSGHAGKLFIRTLPADVLFMSNYRQSTCVQRLYHISAWDLPNDGTLQCKSPEVTDGQTLSFLRDGTRVLTLFLTSERRIPRTVVRPKTQATYCPSEAMRQRRRRLVKAPNPKHFSRACPTLERFSLHYAAFKISHLSEKCTGNRGEQCVKCHVIHGKLLWTKKCLGKHKHVAAFGCLRLPPRFSDRI